jgi:hypothetical protein
VAHSIRRIFDRQTERTELIPGYGVRNGGVVLRLSPVVRPAREVFSPAELEARLEAIRQRVVRECPRLQRGRWYYKLKGKRCRRTTCRPPAPS